MGVVGGQVAIVVERKIVVDSGDKGLGEFLGESLERSFWGDGDVNDGFAQRLKLAQAGEGDSDGLGLNCFDDSN